MAPGTSSTSSKDGESIKVIVRCRPMNEKEKNTKGTEVIIETDTDKGTCGIKNKEEKSAKDFTYDGSYGTKSTTSELYDDVGYISVASVPEGYNATVFAYGQTGCGKSYTMQGIPDPPTNHGFIPRSFADIFESPHLTKCSKFLIYSSYLEIYNEEIRDLLATNKPVRSLSEHPSKGVYVKDLTMSPCTEVQQCMELMEKGVSVRATGSTQMNAQSSRSHSIFTIYVETEVTDDKGGKHVKVGKLNLVDLAGSERQGKTGATGERLREGAKINLSLSALGNVINALVDGRKKGGHIPYRDSKLTRLLQDSLGGNTKTLMIACISPSSDSYEETLSTLRYADRAKQIKNKPKINEDPKDTIMRQMQEEIERLKMMLSNKGQSPHDTDLNALQQRAEDEGKIEKEKVEEMKKEKEKMKNEYNEEVEKLKNKFNAEKNTSSKLKEKIDELETKYQKDFNKLEVKYNKQIKLKETEIGLSKKQSLILQKKQQFIENEKNLLKGSQESLTVTTNALYNEGDEAMHPTLITSNAATQRLKYLSKQLEHGTGDSQAAVKEKQRKHDAKSKHARDKANKLRERQDLMTVVSMYTDERNERKEKEKRIVTLGEMLQDAKREMKDLSQEFQKERDTHLSTIRELGCQMEFYEKMVSKMQSYFVKDSTCNYAHTNIVKESSKYEKSSQGGDDEWQLPEVCYNKLMMFKSAPHSNNVDTKAYFKPPAVDRQRELLKQNDNLHQKSLIKEDYKRKTSNVSCNRTPSKLNPMPLK